MNCKTIILFMHKSSKKCIYYNKEIIKQRELYKLCYNNLIGERYG